MWKTNFSNLFILLLIFVSSTVLAQTTGKIVGTVTDGETNDPLPGANVLVLDTNLGAATDTDGKYFVLNVQPGTYTVEIQMMGYGTVRKEGVRVSINRTVTVDAELNATVIEGEVVTIAVERATIKKDQTSSIRNISSDEIETLPIDNIGQIVRMQPGVVGSHFRGGRSSEGAYMVDGVLVTESFNHESAMVEVTPQAVEDMEVITGTFNAEYGNAMSGIVNVVTKDGSNKIEGGGSVNFGNYLTSHNDIFIGLDNADVRIQDYTLSLSGPILKDRVNFVLDSRYVNDRGHLNGIHRFNVDDYSDFREYPIAWTSEAHGNNNIVDLNDNDQAFFLGKLIFRPISSLKTFLSYTFNRGNYQNYSHQYRFNPYGLPKTHNTSNMVAFHLNHMLSPKAFYELVLSHSKLDHGNYLYKDPLDPRYVHDFYNMSTGQWFSTGGQSKNHSLRTETKSGIKFDFTWQAHRNHSLKTGINLTDINLNQQYSNIRNVYEGSTLEAFYQVDSLTNKRIYPYYEPEVRADTTIYSDHYQKKPREFAAYIQDKMEFDAMVVNLGLRFDYFDPNTVYPTNWRNPANQDLFQEKSRMSDYPKAEPTSWLSPRLGLSYKLGDAALLRFSYGHFLQVPPLNYYYQNHTFRVTELGQMGNPQLKPQKTVSYEVGLWLELTKQMDMEVAVYYRDIYDLLSSRIVYTYSQIRYGLFDNKDYGNVRGLELQYHYHVGNFSLDANYTLQYTRGVADSPEFAFNRAGQDRDPVNKLIPLGWDQRHTLNLLWCISSGCFQFGTSLFLATNS